MRCAVLGGLVIIALTGCQTLSETSRQSQIHGNEAVLRAKAVPSEPNLTLEDLLALAKRSTPVAEVVARLEASGVRFDLTPTQIVDLAGRGMPLPVLEAIHLARERAAQNECAQRLVDFDRQCSEAVMRERRRALVCPDPYWPGRPGGRGSVYWGG